MNEPYPILPPAPKMTDKEVWDLVRQAKWQRELEEKREQNRFKRYELSVEGGE